MISTLHIIWSLAGSGVLAMCAQGKGRYAALSFLCNLLLDGVKFGAEKLGIYNIRDDGHAISVGLNTFCCVICGHFWSY